MKSGAEINDVFNNIEQMREERNVATNFSGMTYEQGIEEALMWVQGEIPDNEFSYSSVE